MKPDDAKNSGGNHNSRGGRRNGHVPPSSAESIQAAAIQQRAAFELAYRELCLAYGMWIQAAPGLEFVQMGNVHGWLQTVEIRIDPLPTPVREVWEREAFRLGES
jgi:hypothetical protein